MSGTKKLVVVTAATAVAAIAAVAIAGASGDSNAFNPIQLARTTGSIPGGSSVAGSDVGSIENALLARVADPSIHAVRPITNGGGGLESDFTVDVQQTGPSAIEPIWKAELVAGALRDLSRDRGAGRIDNYLISVRTPDGDVQASDSGFGNVSADQVFDETAPNLMRARIAKGASALGASLDSFTALPVLQSAPVIVLTTGSPKEFVDKLQLQSNWQALLGDYNNYEGFYVEARDASGTPFMITAVANRTGANSSWIRSDLNPSQVQQPVSTGQTGG